MKRRVLVVEGFQVFGVMYDSVADFETRTDARTAVVAVGASRRGLDSYLEGRLKLAREDPEALAKQVERECLDALSNLNRLPLAEFEKQTGRRAGGGKLVRGS